VENQTGFGPVGKTLEEAAPELYTELVEHLARRNLSPAGCVLNDDEVSGVLERLKSAVIREACGCGQVDCKTYRFHVPAKEDKHGFHTVRLNARGEFNVQIDAECDIFKVERLYDLSGKSETRYARNAAGEWERVIDAASGE